MTTTTMTEIEIDTQLSGLYNRLATLESRAVSYEKSIKEGRLLPYQEKDYRNALVEIEEGITEVSDQIAPLEIEYRARGGWNRYYIVQNANGHIHTSMHCTTCYNTTQYGWLTQVSGKSHNEVVELAGEGACTICFPNAPVTKKINQLDPRNEAKAERAAAKAKRDAEKAAKAIANADGTALKDSHGMTIETERAAQIEVTDLMMYRIWGWGSQNAELVASNNKTIEEILAALANKRNQSVEAVRAEMQKKAAIKAKK